MIISNLTKEEMAAINVLTERVQKRKQENDDAPHYISTQRTRSYMASWKETGADPANLRRVKAFARVLDDSPAVIRDGELIVGSETKYIHGNEMVWEFEIQDILDAVEKGKILGGRGEMGTAQINEEEKSELKEIAEFGKCMSVRELVRAALRREGLGEYIEMGCDGVRVIDTPIEWAGHPLPIFNPRVYKEGLNGIIARAKAEKEKVYASPGKLGDISPAIYDKLVTLNGIILTCDALIRFAKKHAELARSLANKKTNPVRKRELKEIAVRCEWVPANPPRTFAEALQSFWFIALGYRKESVAICPGRMDQDLYPFYEADLKQERLTKQEAAELLALLWVKMNELENFKFERLARIFPGTPLLQQVTLSGQTKEGKDATNDLSFLILEVTRQLKLPAPGVYVRWHTAINHDFMVKAVETNRETGAGLPAFLNDQSAVNRLLALGVSREDAEQWTAVGCLTFALGHCQFQPHALGFIIIPKVLEITLNNGIDPRTGKKVGLETGDVTKFTSMEQLYGAYWKQFDFFADWLAKGSFIGHSARMANHSLPMLTAMLDDCITKGLDAYQGGWRYSQLSIVWGVKGQPELADCLAAIKKLVFDEKKITMAQLVSALKANFEGNGYSDIQRLCLQAPKYGNDDDYADDIYNYVTLKTNEIITSKLNPWTGKPMLISRQALATHFFYGDRVGALPNGRKAYLPLYDGGLSPMQGQDVNGPTAVINSVTKVNHATPEQNGNVLNMKFSRQVLQTKASIERFIAMMKTFFERGGWHIQFNIINKEELLEAQKHPEQYKHLIVRVAGYSAYFVELPRDLQDEIIARTEQAI